MRKSKGIGCEVEVIELTQGMRITRARARTLAMESAAKTTTNKRKFDSIELEQCRNNRRRLLRRRRTRSETLLRNSGEEDIPTTRCSSNGSKIPSYREESTTNNLESMERPSVSRNNDDERSEKSSPTEAEIDDFFSLPEKEEERRFANKYNYDIAKDVPLNGRYEWVRLKP
ncbi:Cyclin-dependent kinase inhibitor [Thalictrum thalictroides]|uniref:Cyclin-dependent kinase inhibitor n=1 Tax=Thalictrum thalictroides TaxID=46969 RepID=A0A7J6W2I0_THATH|nr:Cyclin-dependent kinase inhibitor [Thalictrum thalictroides]